VFGAFLSVMFGRGALADGFDAVPFVWLALLFVVCCVVSMKGRK
jgi:hypothetical protein